MEHTFIISEPVFKFLIYVSTAGVGLTVSTIIGIFIKEFKDHSIW